MAKKTEVQVQYAPNDVISSITFAPQSNQFLLVGSWDGSCRLYDVIANNMRQKYLHSSPVLDVAFQVKFSNIPALKFFHKLSIVLILGFSSCRYRKH